MLVGLGKGLEEVHTQKPDLGHTLAWSRDELWGDDKGTVSNGQSFSEIN
jgi:hypothetical protein